MLINNAMSDAQLAEALLKIEELTKEVEDQKEQVKAKVCEDICHYGHCAIFTI